jgi:vacuolar-type H+-ATPase subunit H
MKLKYYIRGLGIGIIITTIVLSIGKRMDKPSDKEIIARARELGMVMKEEISKDITEENLEQVLGKSLDKDKSEALIDDTVENKPSEANKNEEKSSDEKAVDSIKDVTQESSDSVDDIIEEATDSVDDIIEDATDSVEDIIEDALDNSENNVEDTIEETTDPTEDIRDDINDREEDMEPMQITFTIERGMSSGKVSELLMQKGLIEDSVDFNNYIISRGKAGVILIGTFTLPKDATYQEILDTIT